MDKQYYLQVGYVDHGYFSPELSAHDTYPDYIEANVMECVNKIQSYQNRNSISFGFMADIHYSHTDNHNVRMLRNMNAYKEIARRAFIDRLILGGDYTNDGCKDYKINNYRELRAHLSGIDYFPVNGNHDDNSIWDNYIEAEKSTNHLTAEELYTLFYNHLPAQGAIFDRKNPGLYYYVNDEVTKVRYIYIDMADIPILFNENGKLVYKKQFKFAVSQRQLDWLVQEALVFDEEGWSIIFITHTALQPSKEQEAEDDECRYLGVLNKLADAYREGESIRDEFYTDPFALKLDVDFGSYQRGEIVGFFAGHHHKDFVEYSKSGIPYIYTGNVIMYDGPMPPRADGDRSELLFDIVTVDKEKRTIYLTRVGAGEDREVVY